MILYRCFSELKATITAGRGITNPIFIYAQYNCSMYIIPLVIIKFYTKCCKYDSQVLLISHFFHLN